MKQNFESKHSIGEEVFFSPFKNDEDELNGEILSVRFTKAKVLYDIYSFTKGFIFDKIPSDQIIEQPLPQPKEEI